MGGQAEFAADNEVANDQNAKDQESFKQAEAQDASQQQHQHFDGLRSGRSFNLNLQRLVNGVRKSFERTPREVQKDTSPPTMRRYFTQALWLDHQDGMHVAHAPPPGMDDAYIPPDSEEDEHEYVEHVDLKAISLAGLREFVRQHKIKRTMCTHQVVKSIIIPATMGARKNVALADTDSLSRFELPAMDSLGAAVARKAAGPAPPYTRIPKRRIPAGMKRRAPYYYVVHAWSRPFMEMVDMLEAHFAGWDGAMYHAPRAGSGGGAAVGGGVAGRLIGMLPPPPGMGPPAHAQFVMPGLAAAGLMFGTTHY